MGEEEVVESVETGVGLCKRLRDTTLESRDEQGFIWIEVVLTVSSSPSNRLFCCMLSSLCNLSFSSHAFSSCDRSLP